MSEVTLDDSQLAAATVAPETRQIVLAGPGAGKSEVVGALAANLVEQHDVYPEDILVISFSRAAVSVVEERTHDVTDEGEVVEVRTIDSLAAQLIDELSDDEHEFRGYDPAIEKAIRLLRHADEPPLARVRHVIVDEVQDVVGVRAEFVLALLHSGVPSEAGFTLLGDPLQSLYDFQLDDAHPLTCDRFLEAVAGRFGAHTVELTGEYRAAPGDAQRISRFRPQLTRAAPRDRLRSLESARADLSPLGHLNMDAVDTIAGWRGNVALLCDTNARAAIAAARLAEHGLSAEMLSGRADRALPAWIARAMANNPTDHISRDEFSSVATDAGCPDPDQSWRQMLDLAGVGDSVDIRKLADALASPRGRNVFGRGLESKVVVSTVHRAKGLEFDNVILVDSEDWTGASPDDDVERVVPMLYVAMSRARRRLTTVDGVDVDRWRRTKPGVAGKPWIKRSWRGRGILGVIMEPHMARALGPASVGVGALKGRAVTWEHAEPLVTETGDELPSWSACVDDSVVARTGEDFGSLLRDNCWGDQFPSLVGGRVEGFETLIGPTPGTGPGRYGMWLSTRVTGPIDLDWK